MQAVENIEFDLGALHFKCVVLGRGFFVAVAPTKEKCCSHVIRAAAGIPSIVERLGPVGLALDHAADLAATATLGAPTGLDHFYGNGLPWTFKDMKVPALKPKMVPGTQASYVALARTVRGVVSRQAPTLEQPQARIRVAPIAAPDGDYADPALPFLKANPFTNEAGTLTWNKRSTTHLASTGTGFTELHALVARGLRVLLTFEEQELSK